MESLPRCEWYARGDCHFIDDDEYLETFVWLAKEYAVDSVIYCQPHWCRKVGLWSQATRHVLKREAGVPTLVIDVDYVDPSYEPDIVLAGGLAKDRAFVKTVEKTVGHNTLVPENPQIVSAIGAALAVLDLARKSNGR